jgi:hypothetical protein
VNLPEARSRSALKRLGVMMVEVRSRPYTHRQIEAYAKKVKADSFDVVYGFLEAYYETGFEGQHLALLYPKTKIEPNPAYDPKATKYPECVPEFRDLRHAISIETYDLLEVYTKNGRRVEAAFPVVKDPYGEHDLNIYPQGVEPNVWKRWLMEERKAVVVKFKRQEPKESNNV